MSHSTVSHNFFHKKLDDPNRRGSSSNIIYEGYVIYSYGRHFPIARLDRDNKVVLFTTASSSISTAKHLSRVRSAIPDGYKVINCIDVLAHNESDIIHNLLALSSEIEDLEKSYTNRKKQSTKYFNAYDITKKLENFISYIKYFKLTKKNVLKYLYADGYKSKDFAVNLLRCNINKKLEAWRSISDQHYHAMQDEEKKEQEKKAKRIAASIEEWKTNTAKQSHQSFFNSRLVYLRRKGNNIQTSKGVTIKLAEALKFYASILPFMKGVTTFNDNISIEVGGFKLNKVDKENEVVVIGCHTIPFSEIFELHDSLKVATGV